MHELEHVVGRGLGPHDPQVRVAVEQAEGAHEPHRQVEPGRRHGVARAEVVAEELGAPHDAGSGAAAAPVGAGDDVGSVVGMAHGNARRRAPAPPTARRTARDRRSGPLAGPRCGVRARERA